MNDATYSFIEKVITLLETKAAPQADDIPAVPDIGGPGGPLDHAVSEIKPMPFTKTDVDALEAEAIEAARHETQAVMWMNILTRLAQAAGKVLTTL